MVYRVGSNKDLGVDFWQALLSGAPVLIPLLGLLAIGLARRHPMLIAIGGSVPVVWVYLMTHDVWGVGAEPYRFWIELFLIGGVALLIGLAPSIAPASGFSPTYAPPGYGSRRPAVLVAGVWLALVALSLPDYIRWATDPVVQQVWDTGTSRMQALAIASGQANDGRLVLTDACINPQSVKVLSAVPVAYFRLGMAWPEDKGAIDDAIRARNSRLTPSVTARARIGWVLTESTCSLKWLAPVQGSLVRVASADYRPLAGYEGGASRTGREQRITLWRVNR